MNELTHLKTDIGRQESFDDSDPVLVAPPI
jgi:hypothetical protein